MAKKKKIRKLTDDQYFAYIMGLRDNAALFDSNGDVVVPDAFDSGKDENEEEN